MSYTNRKKIIFLVLAIVMIFSIAVTGCKKADTQTQETTKSEKTTAKTEKTTEATEESVEEPTTISIVVRCPAYYVFEDNPVIDVIEELANVKIEMNLPPKSNYMEKVHIIMASGDLPDLININDLDEIWVKYAEEGLIISLDEYLPDTPNITNCITEEQFAAARITKLEGKLYAIPRPSVMGRKGGLIRQDWLDNLNLEVPNTADEFFEVATAFATQDPDGNGKNDTYGWSVRSGTKLYDDMIKSAFDIRGYFVPDENGKVGIPESQAGYVDMLRFYRKLYESKGLDLEYYLNDGGQDQDKYEQGKVGICSQYQALTDVIGSVNNRLTEAFPEAEQGFIMPLESRTDGKRRLWKDPAIWGSFMITADCEKPEKVMQFIDWGFSDEGWPIMSFGREGVDYKSFDRETKNLDYAYDGQVDEADVHLGYFKFRNAYVDGLRLQNPGDSDEQRVLYNDMATFYMENLEEYVITPPAETVSEYAQMYSDNPELKDQLYTEITRYIVGENTEEQMLAFLNEQWLPKNEPVIAAMQKYYDENMK